MKDEPKLPTTPQEWAAVTPRRPSTADPKRGMAWRRTMKTVAMKGDKTVPLPESYGRKRR